MLFRVVNNANLHGMHTMWGGGGASGVESERKKIEGVLNESCNSAEMERNKFPLKLTSDHDYTF